jgi:hypothetical protein
MPAQPRVSRRPRTAVQFRKIVATRLAEQATPPPVRELTAREIKQRTVVGRRRCDNYGKLISLTVQNKENKRFCGPRDPGKGLCQGEFHRNGGNAFGPLKERLTKLVILTVEERLAELVISPTFRDLIERAGFVHRADLKKRPPEMTAAAIRGSINVLTKLVREGHDEQYADHLNHEQRILALEMT